MNAWLAAGSLIIAALLFPAHAFDVIGLSIYVPPPAITDSRGNAVEGILSGQQVTISYSYDNTNDRAQPFVMLFEIRDDDGVSVLLAWQTGVAESGGTSTAGVSWMPEYRGDHEIRIFVIDKFDDPRVLSPVSAHSVFVG